MLGNRARALAKKLGIDKQYIYKYNDERSDPIVNDQFNEGPRFKD